MNHLRALLAVAALVLGLGLSLSASAANDELDNESKVTNEQSRLAQQLPGTLIVRTNRATGQSEVLPVTEALPAEASAQAIALEQNAEFKPFSQPGGELDQDSSRSSWYFYWNGYYPHCYYGGYNYYGYPYYNFGWGLYQYNYYRWYW